MANTASRLSANGSLTISGSFDEITRISANGLILYYDAGKSYPTGYGTTLNDLSSSNNTGILINGPVYTSANSGHFNLNGSGYIASSIQYLGPNEFTIGVWFRTPTAGTGKKLIGFSNGQYGTYLLGAYEPLTYESSYDRQLYIGSDNKVYFGIYPNQVVTINTSGTYTDNVWHYAVGTFSGSQSLMRLYVDGVLIGSNTQFSFAQAYTGSWKIGGLAIGGWPSSSVYNYFLGAMGPAEVYSRALTADEVLQNYNVDAARFGGTPTSYTSSKTTANAVYITGEFNEVDYNPNNIGPTKNMFANSEDFTQQFTWSPNSITQQKNYAIAPDNKQTATLITGTAQYPLIYYLHPSRTSYNGLFFGEPGKYYTQSLFVKYVNQQYCVFVCENWVGTGNSIEFDLINGTASGIYQQAVGRKIEKYDNGWWRISVNILIPFATNTDSRGYPKWNPQWRMGRYDGTNYTGSQMLVWGMQLEEGNTASTYVATGFPKNILTFTNDFGQINNWYAENCNVSNSPALDPNGNYKGQLLSSTITGGTNTGFVQETLYPLPINTNYTYSVYLKQGTSPTTYLNFYNASPFTQLVTIITWPTIPGNTPTVSYSDSATRLGATITPAANGWWRFSLSMNNGTSSTLVWRIYTTTSNPTNVAGYNVYIWGPQLEFGLTPTTYIENGSTFTNILPLANTNTLMKTTNTGNTFIKDTFDEYSKMSPITEGLIFNIDPGYNSSYTGSGSTMYDTTQNRYKVDLNNSPAYTDNFGGILKFTSTFGNNAWGNTSIPSGIITTTSNYTMSAWVKCNPTMRGLAETSFYDLATSAIVSPQANTGYSYGSTGSILGNNFYGGYGLYWATRLNNNGIKELTFGLQNRINSPSLQQSSPLQTVTLNNSAIYLNWTHIVGVYNSSGNFCGFYVNGVLVNSTTTSQMSVGSFPFTYSTLRICSDGITGGNPTGRNFDGDTGPMSIWNRALSDSEIQQMYSSQRGRFGI